jgi:hypothetical protein
LRWKGEAEIVYVQLAQVLLILFHDRWCFLVNFSGKVLKRMVIRIRRAQQSDHVFCPIGSISGKLVW